MNDPVNENSEAMDYGDKSSPIRKFSDSISGLVPPIDTENRPSGDYNYVIEIIVKTERPLKINDIKDFLSSIGDDYNEFLKNSKDNDLGGVELRLGGVSRGSYVFELIPYVMPMTPLLFYPKFEKILDWFTGLAEFINLFKGNEESEKISRATTSKKNIVKHSSNILQHDGSANSSITINGKENSVVFNNFNLVFSDLPALIKGIKESDAIAPNSDNLNDSIFRHKEIGLTYTKVTQGGSSKQGDSGMVDIYGEKIFPIKYADQLIKQQMLQIKENPLDMRYEVDADEVVRNGQTAYFTITRFITYYDLTPS